MSEEKQVPAEQKEPAMQPPMNPMNTGITKASEKVEMQRVTADVYAMHQRAMQQGRDETACYKSLLSLCQNIEFASTFMYKIPRGSEKVEGIGIDGANEIARVWGHIDSGSVTHGTYNNEAQMEAFAIDLVGPRRRSSRFTVNIAGRKNPSDVCKAEAAKEERNCILDVVPAYVKAGMQKEAKRTLLAAVKDVPKAFNDAVKAFVALGVTEDMLWQYIGGKKNFEKVTEADIVDIRMLYSAALKDEKELDQYFPNRKKSGVAATEAPKSKPATEPPKTSKPASTDGGTKPSTTPAVATEPPKSKGSLEPKSPASAEKKTAASPASGAEEKSAPAAKEQQQAVQSVSEPEPPKPEEPASAPVDAESPSTQEEQDSATTATSETAESESEPENDAPEENDTEPEPEQEAAPAEAPAKKRGVDLW